MDYVKRNVQNFLSNKYGKQVEISKIDPISGGSINQAFRIKTNLDTFFLKVNNSKDLIGMFKKEIYGLEELRRSKGLSIPKVIGLAGENEDILILEYIERGEENTDFWKTFGNGLSQLHEITSSEFGLDFDNYIGNLIQNNSKKKNWVEFYVGNRLEVQIRECRNKKLICNDLLNNFERLFKMLPSIIPVENPSLVHGDLWNGNYLVGSKGKVFIFDPAIYFGHREIDIAMTLLFGGFDEEFYQSYNERTPLESGWKERIGIFQLYPLLVHLNLFGLGYLRAVENIVKKY